MPVDATKRLEAIHQRLQTAADYGCPVPTLIAVTKTRTPEEIHPVLQAGIIHIGENRCQEIQEKWPRLLAMAPDRPLTLHMIGRLQSNKVKTIIQTVDLIHSLDRLSLAEEVHRQASIHEKVQDVLLQVNPASEPQKGGIRPEDAEIFLRQVSKLRGIRVRGLMAIMPLTTDVVWLDQLFRSMHGLFDRLKELGIAGVTMEELSMGMSADYHIALRHGTTMVRLGSAIFGH